MDQLSESAVIKGSHFQIEKAPVVLGNAGAEFWGIELNRSNQVC